MSSFDYIIVGSGTAGATLAARLTEDPKTRVLLLEAGGSDRGFWQRLPVGYFKSIYDPRVSKLYRAAPDPGINGRQMDVPRGQVLGGSSSINGLIFIRGQRQDFDDWAALGARGWSYNDVLPHFRSIETYHGGPDQFRGAHGPLQISDLRNENPLCDAWLEAARQWGLPENPDFNGAETYGLGRYQLTLRGRWRDSAATAFLRPARKRANLRIETRARALGLTFEGRHVTGVRYRQRGQELVATAHSEVILSAGAIQSPQVLMLSGIGPASQLTRQGIEVKAHASEVGQNLQDHLQMRTIVALREGKHSLNRQVRNPLRVLRMGLDWMLHAKGPLTVGAGQVGGAACSPLAEDGRPDLQLFVMPLSVDKPGRPLHRYAGFTVSYWQCHPESRGTVALASHDPMADPDIKMNYLRAERDRATMIAGLKLVREIYRQPAFRDHWREEVVPGEGARSEAEILDAIRNMSGTVYHPVGTCRMGDDATSVVDPELRVRGVSGLRVVDASVMPKITSANTNAATYMIAEKAAAMIRG